MPGLSIRGKALLLGIGILGFRVESQGLDSLQIPAFVRVHRH